MSLKKIFSTSFIIIFFYLVFHHLQLLVYSGNFFSDEINTYAYSIYMPHGLRILFFLIYGYWCIPGLLIAHILASLNIEWASYLDLSYSVLIPTFCVPVAALIIEKFKNEIENKFTITYLVLITVLSTFINGLVTNILRYCFVNVHDRERFFDELMGYFIGDISGVVITILSFLILKRIFILSIEKVS